MRIVMDFDGVYTDPTQEGVECYRYFKEAIAALKLPELPTSVAVDSWLGELLVRLSSKPTQFGWRSEGRISAFYFEDPFIRSIGLADFLDYLAQQKDSLASKVLMGLAQSKKISRFSELSEWAFHQLQIKKQADAQALQWVKSALSKGTEVWIVSNSSTEKIDEFLNQNGFDSSNQNQRPKVRGGAKKFGLGQNPKTFTLAQDNEWGEILVDSDRPLYEQALMEIKPDAIIGDVLSLDLTLPIRLKREGKLDFKWGIFYRIRDYTPSKMVDWVSGKNTKVPEIKIAREWRTLEESNL